MKLTKLLTIGIGFIILIQGINKLKSQNLTLQTANLSTCTVKPGSVYDGDTLRVLCNGQELKIRFACIDAPETKQPGGIEARDHLRSLLSNANNQVKLKTITTDKYKRTVAELYTSAGELVQLRQVKVSF